MRINAKENYLSAARPTNTTLNQGKAPQVIFESTLSTDRVGVFGLFIQVAYVGDQGALNSSDASQTRSGIGRLMSSSESVPFDRTKHTLDPVLFSVGGTSVNIRNLPYDTLICNQRNLGRCPSLLGQEYHVHRPSRSTYQQSTGLGGCVAPPCGGTRWRTV